jgi:hypothetical protein
MAPPAELKIRPGRDCGVTIAQLQHAAISDAPVAGSSSSVRADDSTRSGSGRRLSTLLGPGLGASTLGRCQSAVSGQVRSPLPVRRPAPTSGPGSSDTFARTRRAGQVEGHPMTPGPTRDNPFCELFKIVSADLPTPACDLAARRAYPRPFGPRPGLVMRRPSYLAHGSNPPVIEGCPHEIRRHLQSADNVAGKSTRALPSTSLATSPTWSAVS